MATLGDIQEELDEQLKRIDALEARDRATIMRVVRNPEKRAKRLARLKLRAETAREKARAVFKAIKAGNYKRR